MIRREISLIWELSKRQTLQRTQGSLLGFSWNLLTPLLLLLLYSVVFGVLFDSRWSGEYATVPYALTMYAGLVLHTLWADTVSGSAYCIQSWVPLVKRSTVKLRNLPLASFVSSYIIFLFNCVPLYALYLFANPEYKLASLLFPVVGILISLSGSAVGLFVSCLSVYFKDVQNVIPLLIAAMLFLNPVFFPLEVLPNRMSSFVEKFSPSAIPIEFGRMSLFKGSFSFEPRVLLFLGLWFATLLVGYRVFEKLSKGFADVL